MASRPGQSDREGVAGAREGSRGSQGAQSDAGASKRNGEETGPKCSENIAWRDGGETVETEEKEQSESVLRASFGCTEAVRLADPRKKTVMSVWSRRAVCPCIVLVSFVTAFRNGISRSSLSICSRSGASQSSLKFSSCDRTDAYDNRVQRLRAIVRDYRADAPLFCPLRVSARLNLGEVNHALTRSLRCPLDQSASAGPGGLARKPCRVVKVNTNWRRRGR